jgi:aspartate-semialdehyde dehydrogenase
MEELFSQSRKIFSNETLADDEQIFKKQIAFNVLPQVGEFIGEETTLEWQTNAEMKKLLQSDVKVHANAAFVPTFIGDGVFVNAEFNNDVDADEVRKQMQSVKGVVVFDKTVDGGYVSVDDVQGEDSIYVSRVRQDVSVENGISFWSVADNLRASGAKLALSVLNLMMRN